VFGASGGLFGGLVVAQVSCRTGLRPRQVRAWKYVPFALYCCCLTSFNELFVNYQ
jgi:hypothetical protein